MAGHSHAANIAHKKAAMDKKRGKIFSKIARKLIVAAKHGGPSLETNLSLKYAFELARAANMPKDVIQRNIDKGAGTSGEGAGWEEILYEGYGPGGVAVLCEILTDNRNRTAGEVKKLFDKGGGNMGGPGCVAFMFDTKSVYVVEPEGKSEDAIMEIVMAAEADDMEKEGDSFVVYGPANRFTYVKQALTDAGLKLSVAEVSRVPKTTTDVADEATAKKLLALIDTLEENDDVQNVYANHVIADELRKKLGS